METKGIKLVLIYAVKKCKFMSTVHQNTFGGRAPPRPAGGANALPQTL